MTVKDLVEQKSVEAVCPCCGQTVGTYVDVVLRFHTHLSSDGKKRCDGSWREANAA